MQSPEEIRFLIDNIPSMVAYWDSDLKCRFANRAYETWFGVSPDALVGTSLRDLLGAELFALNEPYIRAALQGRAQNFERVVPGPGGVRRNALAWYIPDVVDGAVRGFLVQVSETTRLKQTEAALLRERGQRAQFEQQAVRLQALLRERSEMLDVLAHEVRQPLNNASAALQSAAAALHDVGEGAAAQRMRRALAVIGEVMARVDNTLAVAALVARAEPLACTDCDVDTLLAVAITDMPAAERGRIHIDRATATRTASMDMSLMRLALRNLLSNALKYSPPGSPVAVQVTDSDDPLALIIDVTDSGPGVEPQVRARLFERGARGSKARAVGGHGLGLYIVRRVMELHNGRVALHRNSPQGATMRLTITQAADS